MKNGDAKQTKIGKYGQPNAAQVVTLVPVLPLLGGVVATIFRQGILDLVWGHHDPLSVLNMPDVKVVSDAEAGGVCGMWTTLDESSLQIYAESAAFYGVTALADDDVWFVGKSECRYTLCYFSDSEGVIAHWDGKELRHVPVAKPEVTDYEVETGYEVDRYRYDFEDVVALSKNDVWAVGGINITRALIEHWDGKEWKFVNAPPKSGKLRAISAVSATDIRAVGGSTFNPVILHWDGKEWASVTTPLISDADKAQNEQIWGDQKM